MKRLLYCSLALSILQSIFFWHKEPGISMVLFLIPAILVVIYNLQQNKKIKNKKGILWSIPIVLLGLTYLIFNNIFFQMINIPIMLGLIIIMCIDITEGNIVENKFIVNIISKIFNPFCKFKEILKKIKIKEVVKEEKENQNEKIKFVKKLIKSVLIAIPLVVIVIILLSSADSIFGNLFYSISNCIEQILNSQTITNIIWRVIWIIFAFIYFLGFIWMFIENDKDKYKLENLQKNEEKNIQKINTFTLNTVLSLLNIIYLIFSIIQFKYLFINAGKETNFDYATYARTGFFQLMFVTFINFAILKISKLKQKDRINNILKIILVIFTILLIISATFRMYLYEQAYGYTYLRLFVYFILATEGLVLIPIIIKYLGKDLDIFKVSLQIIVLMYIILNFINIDAIIARNNINRYLQNYEENDLDISYIITCTGTDALKEKIKLLEQTPNNVSYEANERLKIAKESVKANLRTYKVLYGNYKFNLREFNLSKYKVKKLLENVDLNIENMENIENVEL